MQATPVRPSLAFLRTRVLPVSLTGTCAVVAWTVLFSEKLIHGTLPWTAPGRERRSLFYKYVRTPGVLPIDSFAQAGR